jgi:Uma2 family endonuclease
MAAIVDLSYRQLLWCSIWYVREETLQAVTNAIVNHQYRQPTLPAKFSIAPDLAVEVVSPSNRPRQMLDKAELYLISGTQLVWVVYPEERVVDVYKLGVGRQGYRIKMRRET